MSTQTIALVSLLINVLFGGGLLGFFVKMTKLRNDRDLALRDDSRVDFTTLLEVVEKQRRDVLEHNSVLAERIEQLEAEIQGLRVARDLDPFPSWLVDLTGRYTFVNRPFEERFLDPKKQTYRDVIGKTHADLWPADFVRTIEALDGMARKRPDGTARANTTLNIPGLGKCVVTIHKFPCRVRGVIVAYAGYITSIEPEGEAIL